MEPRRFAHTLLDAHNRPPAPNTDTRDSPLAEPASATTDVGLDGLSGSAQRLAEHRVDLHLHVLERRLQFADAADEYVETHPVPPCACSSTAANWGSVRSLMSDGRRDPNPGLHHSHGSSPQEHPE